MIASSWTQVCFLPHFKHLFYLELWEGFSIVLCSVLDEYLKVALVMITEQAETGDRRVLGISAAVVRWREAEQTDTMFK